MTILLVLIVLSLKMLKFEFGFNSLQKVSQDEEGWSFGAGRNFDTMLKFRLELNSTQKIPKEKKNYQT